MKATGKERAGQMSSSHGYETTATYGALIWICKLYKEDYWIQNAAVVTRPDRDSSESLPVGPVFTPGDMV